MEEAKELFILIILSKQVIEYTKIVNKRIVKNRGAFAIEYNL